MPNFRQALGVVLSGSLVVTTMGLDGCSKKTQSPEPSEQVPSTTYATPTPDQLSQLVAPVALFPDNLLAQVLAASTYPDQIAAAYQWLQRNSGLKGQQLLQAVDQEPWDDSVKGLTQFSDVLQQMATSLAWTSALGDAYYNVPQSVMNAVQVMRQRAYQAGNLKSNPQQNVAVQSQPAATVPAPPASSGQPEVTVVQAPPQTIIIQPAQPDVVYVPTYNPTAVYGAPVAAYPGYSTGQMVATSLLSFGLGIAVGAAISGGSSCCGWGWNSWGVGWHNSTVVYNNNTYISTSNTFVNRNNYYNRNVNNRNINNFNQNNINANNINRSNNSRANNINRGGVENAGYRTNNFNSQSTAPRFNQERNQQQFRNQNQGNAGQPRTGNQPTSKQQDRPQAQNRGALQANESRPNTQAQNRGALQANEARPNTNFNQNQRQPQRGYGQQASPGSDNSAFGNYGQGGNARTNSARGQQSLEGRNTALGGGASGGRSGRGGEAGRRR